MDLGVTALAPPAGNAPNSSRSSARRQEAAEIERIYKQKEALLSQLTSLDEKVQELRNMKKQRTQKLKK